ncbi:hypothetical protein HK097_001862 [Rhizophlyctis rosea]|uniref:3-hydroxyacyl-CoA dehydrogenase n=1 Tax=Rhizophlyctis rosea TaxID=64517 RepID=A0AAD5WY41_9FUNG|nr:hypothetical protein HK097_001862 [Rhizophlyctis rosea]
MIHRKLARTILSPAKLIIPIPTISYRHASSESKASSGPPPPPPETVKKIGVVGAGQMGAGIAQVAAGVAKLPVLLHDANKAQIDKAFKFIDVLLQKDVLKGKITSEEKDETLGRITKSDIADFKDVDFAIEAISENSALKRELLGVLEKALPDTAILASNTSSISITRLAAATKRPEKVIGMHFMNPVPVMKLVEIIPGLATSPQTLQTTLALSHSMGKTTTQSSDMPGFIANRVLMPYINEAIYVLQEGIAIKEDIDTTMKLGTNVPMGPLTLADFIGLDTCLAILKVLHTQLGDDKYRPSPLLVKYVDAGWLGKKTGRGFYTYEKSKKK